MSLLQMSFSGAVFILVIVIVRAVMINRLPKRTFLVLWGIALIRLLVPVSVPSPVSVYSLLGQNETIYVLNDTFIGDIILGMQGQKTHTSTAGSLFQSNLEELSQTGHSQTQFPQTEDLQVQSPMMKPTQIQPTFLQQPETNVHSIFTWPISVWLVVWCMGMVLGIVFFTVFYLRWYFRFQTALPVRNDYIEQWLGSHRLERQILVKQSDRIAAPLTYGILHPVILLPKKTDWENTKQLQYVLLHEYVHIRRFDTVTKIVAAIALCIHWFNPFVWVMYILFNRDMELSCDESVVRLSGITSRSDYAHVLIDMEARKSGLMPFYNNFSKNAIEERITYVMKIKKTSLIAIVIAVVLIIGLVAVFATSALSIDNGNTIVELTEENMMDELIEVDPDDIQEAQVSEPVFIDCGIELRTDVTGNGLPDQVRVYDNNDTLITSVTLTSANGEEAQFDYNEELWASSYLVSGDLSGNGAADIVLMRTTNGMHGDGPVSVLHVTKEGAFGKLIWREYSDAFIHNPSINMGQPGTFDDIACVGATVVEQSGRYFLRLIALDMEDSEGDTVQCIDCSLRGNGWYIEEMQTVTGYYTENKMEELLRNNLFYLQGDTADDAGSGDVTSDHNGNQSELLMQDPQYVETLAERCIWDNIHNVYLGRIGNEEIRMIITREGERLSAAYITRSNEEKFFNGELNSDLAKVYLNTDDGEYLEGNLGIDDNGFFGISFEGVLSGNRVDFTVNWETFFSFGEDTTNYYSFMRYDSKSAEQFAKQIKDSVGNANAFARLVQYPISIDLDGERILIENEKEMTKLYDRLMEENGFRQQVENMFTKYLFANYQGICVEDGIIWFNIDRDEKYKITAINPPRPDDARELEDFMTMFYTAYFNKDRETLQGCFADSFDGRIDFINEINSVDEIEIIGIKGLESGIQYDSGAILSLEFAFPNEDSYSYLTVGVIKDKGVWKVEWYGLEK